MFGGKKLQAGLLKGADAVLLTCFQLQKQTKKKAKSCRQACSGALMQCC